MKKIKMVEMMRKPLKIISFQSALAIGAFMSIFVTAAEAQRYNGRCGQPPREPFCVTKRNLDDRQIQDCQGDLRNYGRNVENFNRCLSNEGRRAEKDLRRMQKDLQSIQAMQQRMSSAIRDAQSKLSCNASGRGFC